MMTPDEIRKALEEALIQSHEARYPVASKGLSTVDDLRNADKSRDILTSAVAVLIGRLTA